MITLPFDALPGIPRLFADYSTRATGATNFFMGHFSDIMTWETHIQQLERKQYQRQRLYDILVEQNKQYRAGVRSLEHLESIKRENSYFVVTGQQVGLFTGPLYTLYKALTAVQLAAWLKDQFPACDFVPLFWLECDDSDFTEINHAGILNTRNEFTRVYYAQPEEDEARNLTPVAHLLLDERIEQSLKELRSALPETDFTESVFRALTAAYRPGTPLHVAFARFFNDILPESGLLFLNPTDAEIKRLAAPVFLQELETYPSTGEEVIQRSAELEELYHAQIKPRAVNLFLLHKNNRYAIEPGDEGFFLKGTRKRFTHEELIDLAAEAPERFSPNVLLRPIMQDYLLPTAAYVGGPSEISYFAQLQPAYDHFQIPMPVIVPRAGITIIERKIGKLFDKFMLPYAAMFLDDVELFRISKDESGDGKTPNFDFASFRSGFEQLLAGLPEMASAEDANLLDPATTTVQNIQRALAHFEDKLLQHRRQRQEVKTKQLGKLLEHLAPEGKLQERQVNVVYLLNLYGSDILTRISSECLPFPAEHRLLLL